MSAPGNSSLDILSVIFGWIYFTAWSVSFFGQVVENFKRKSVSGLSFDFLLYNLTGFAGYSIYTVWGYVDNVGTGHVSIQDVVFALHSVFMTLFTIFQVFVYYDKTDPSQKLSHTCITVTLCLWWGIFQIILVERIIGLYDARQSRYFNSIIYLGWCKVFMSLIKHIPQVISNFRRKSTVGWNIHNIILDFTGGAFSFGQNFVDYLNESFAITPDGQPQSLNIAKYALSFLSIFFDIIYLVQHYILFRKPQLDKKYEGIVHNVDLSDH